MENYPFPYPPSYGIRPQDGGYPDRGDGFGDYYDAGPAGVDRETRRSRSRNNKRRSDSRKRSHSSTSVTQTRTRHSKTRSISRSHSRRSSRSRSGSRSRSRSQSRSRKEIHYRQPSFLDAFRILYLTPSKQKSTTKYLTTKKRHDHIQEILKSDGLGSKKWLFYPRPKKDENLDVPVTESVRDNCDQRVKVDADFFRKYKKSKKIDLSAPIAKLKRWELILYKKLGFIQAVE